MYQLGDCDKSILYTECETVTRLLSTLCVNVHVWNLCLSAYGQISSGPPSLVSLPQ